MMDNKSDTDTLKLYLKHIY